MTRFERLVLPGADFSAAYLAALAETAGVGDIASFDRTIDRVPAVNRIEP